MNPPDQLQEIPRPRGNRISDSELERRVQDVVRLVEEGCPRSEILAHCEKEYGASRSTTDRYIEKAHEYFKEAYKPHLQRSAEIARRRLETIFNKSMHKEQFRTALMAQTQLSRIQGLHDNLIMARIRTAKTNQNLDF
jgi:hypothetical protein